MPIHKPSLPPRLSVVMLVRDEQETLADSLASVQPIADELLVIDTGSRDASRQIAQRCGARVVDRPWERDFAAARNAGLAAAAGDYVLWLDAGERMEPEDAGAVATLVRHHAQPSKLYYLMVQTPTADSSSGGEQVARARLMPRRDGLRFSGRVAESVRAQAAALAMTSELLPQRIVRHARDARASTRAARAQRNLQLVELAAAEGDPSPALLVVKAEALATLGEHHAAALVFHQVVRSAPRGSLEMLEAYYGLLGALEVNPEFRDRQLSICLEAIEVFPLDTQLLCVMGGYLQSQNRPDLAERAFRLAVEHGRVEAEISHRQDIGTLAVSCLAASLQLAGDSDAARQVLENALNGSAESTALRRQLLTLLVARGQTDEALQQVARLNVDLRHRATLRAAVRGACLAATKNWIQAWSLLNGAYQEGCRDPLCLRWLAVTLLSTGQAQSAEPILLAWQAIEPWNGEVRELMAVAARPAGGEAVPRAAAAPAASLGQKTLRLDPAGGPTSATPGAARAATGHSPAATQRAATGKAARPAALGE